MKQIWDVVIAGAGPAGAVAAHGLARSGRRTLLVDDVQPAARKVGESLPGAAKPLLRDLGLLAVLENGSHLPCRGNLSAWGSDRLEATDFIRDPHGFGWRLDRPRFDADLRDAAARAGACLRAGRLCSALETDDGWLLELTEGQASARWLIDATGRRATIARSLGIRRRRDDPLVALTAWAAGIDNDLDTRTLVESCPDGWWYTALLPDRTRVAVLHVDAREAPSILRPTEAWRRRLEATRHVRTRLSEAPLIEGPKGGEAAGARLDVFAGRRWLAVGDAALSFDPLSSQGIFNAIYTGMKATQAIDAALSGERGSVNAYAARLEEIRSAYLARHRLVYQSELRWRDRPFWSRRHSAALAQP